MSTERGARWCDVQRGFDGSVPGAPDPDPQREPAAAPANASAASQPEPEVQGAPVPPRAAEAEDLGKSGLPQQGPCGDSSPSTLAVQAADAAKI